jgi:Flp pilus assembly protein TadD
MNKYVSALVLVISMSTAFAQNAAIIYDKEGKLDKAKEEIDKAILDTKLSAKAKTWFARGQIYEHIANDPTKIFSKLDTNAAFVAFESYKKATELDKPGGSFDKDSKTALSSQSLYAALFNQAIQRYQAKNYVGAIKAFQLSQETNPKDTLAALYTAIASHQNNDLPLAKASYEKYIDLGGKEVEIYNSLAGLYVTDKETDKALSVITKGLVINPSNKNLKDQELNILLTTGKIDQAIDNLKKAIEREPTNAQYQLNLGILYDNAGKKDEAQAIYKKVLEIEPNNFDANYNLGVFYFNQGAEETKKLNKLDINQYNKVGKKIEAEIQSKFQQALPYFEKAHQANSKDIALMENLVKVYTQLKKPAEAEKMTKAIESAENKK